MSIENIILVFFLYKKLNQCRLGILFEKIQIGFQLG